MFPIRYDAPLSMVVGIFDFALEMKSVGGNAVGFEQQVYTDIEEEAKKKKKE